MGNQLLDLFPECRTETLHMSSQDSTWKKLYGLAEVLLRSPEVLKRELHIMARLYHKFGANEVERMLLGAQLLGWDSLKSLGSAEGLGRRWALTAFWQSENKQPDRLASVAAVLKAKGFQV